MPRLPFAAAAAALLLVPAAAGARTVDLAVVGDIPYGDHRVAVFPQNIQQINADPTVSTVIHVGDIKPAPVNNAAPVRRVQDARCREPKWMKDAVKAARQTGAPARCRT